MLTIFTIPKPHINKHIETIQTNAFWTWRQVFPSSKIIVLGDGEGIANLAKSIDAIHVEQISSTKFGTPLLSDAFKKATKLADSKLLMYTNADMIYGPNLINAINSLPTTNLLGVGQRYDMDILKSVSRSKNWWQQLDKERILSGLLHPPMGSDYFIFRKGDFLEIPPFAVGRVRWDNWMIEHAIRNKMHVVDMTNSVTAIHQNHDYSHQLNKGKDYLNNEESRYNIALSGDIRPHTLLDCNEELSFDGTIKQKKTHMKNRLYLWLKNIIAQLQ